MTAAKKMTQAQKKSEKVEAESPMEAFNLDAVAKANGEAFDAMLEANRAMMNGIAALNGELMAFADQRLRQDIERGESLMGCTKAEDALRVQMDFAETARQDYLREAHKVMDMMMEISKGCWAPVESQARQTFQAFNPGKAD